MQSSSPPKGALVAGRYRIDAELGRGGHGVVFRATQQPLGHEVALKMLLPEAVLAEGSVARFMREAALAQRLEHPNTVRLFDFGQTEQGLPFIVWELLRGRTLEQEIARAPLDARRVSRVAAQVLKSLMEAHARGIVHRDIKPQNVFLCDHAGETDFVKVLDFGVATTLPGTTQGPPVTRSGQLIGTPNYMAPEQVNGAPLSPRTDLYALGLVMAEALSGTCVIEDTSPIKVWMMQASAAPVPLPQVVSHSILGAVITRATRKPAHERYASAEEMLVDLERAMSAATAATDPFQRPLSPTMPITAPPPPVLSGPPATPHALSHPAVMPAAPTPTPMTLQAASTMSGLLVATLVGTLIAILGLVAVVALLLFRGASTKQPTFEGTTTTTTIGTGSGNGVQAGALSHVTKERALDRIKSAGWTIVTVNDNHSAPGFSITTISVARRPSGGTVQVYDYEGLTTAALTEDGLKKTADSAVARDGGKIVYVVIFGDRAASTELLNTLIR